MSLDLHAIMSAMSRTPRHLAVTTLAASLLLLAACSGGKDHAKPSDDVPSGNTATTQPTKTSAPPTTILPTKPPAQPTSTNALAVAVAAVKAIDRAYLTWDVRSLRRLSNPACSACQDIITTLPARQQQGYRMSGGHYKIDGNPRIFAGTAASHYVIVKVPTSISTLTTTGPDGRIYNNPNDVVGSDVAHNGIITNLDLKWIDDRWQVTNLGYNE